MGNKTIDAIHNFLTKRKVIVIIIILIGVFGALYSFLPKDDAPKIVINPKKPDRHVDEEFATQLANRLPKNKESTIDILYIVDNKEAERFAQEIKYILEINGWKIGAYGRSIGIGATFDESLSIKRVKFADLEQSFLIYVDNNP